MKTASESYDLVVLCDNCSELKRRKHRSDALGWQRLHEKEKPSHDVSIVERKAEAKEPKSKQSAAEKKGKGKAAKAKTAKPKAEAQAAWHCAARNALHAMSVRGIFSPSAYYALREYNPRD